MAKKKSRVSKKSIKNKAKLPRWVLFVVIGLVAAIGIYFVYNSFAANGIIPKVNTKTIIEGGYGGEANVINQNVAKKSPIEVVACRMSDILGDGPENRIYIGAKPIVTQALADKLNAVWDKEFPEYHINGQDVPWAADYAMQKNVYFEADYYVDNNNRTETSTPYGQLNTPSQIFNKNPKGGWWSGEDYFSTYDQGMFPPILARIGGGVNYGPLQNQYPYNQYKVDPNPNISGAWAAASFSGNPLQSKALYQDKANNIEELLKYNKDVTGNVGRQGTSQDNADLAKQIPTNFLRPGVLPGRTTWTYKSGKVMVYNQDKCPTRDSGCLSNPNSYDVINNPNPMIVIKAKWNTNKVQSSNAQTRIPGTTPSAPVYPEEKVEKGVRFKDLPKCGQSPIGNTQAQINEFNKIKTKLNQQMAKATQQRLSSGINGTAWTRLSKGPETWKGSDIDVNNGLSPLFFNDFWTTSNNPSVIYPVKS